MFSDSHVVVLSTALSLIAVRHKSNYSLRARSAFRFDAFNNCGQQLVIHVCLRQFNSLLQDDDADVNQALAELLVVRDTIDCISDDLRCQGQEEGKHGLVQNLHPF